MVIPVEVMHGVLQCAAFSSFTLENCHVHHHSTSLLIAAGVRLAPTVAAASSAAHVFYLGTTERRNAGMIRRAFEVAPDGVASIAVADLDSSAGCAQTLDDVVRTQPNSIRVARVSADTPGPCAKLMRVCATWGPTSLRDLFVDARSYRRRGAADPDIEKALTHCTGGLTSLRVPDAAVLALARARSLATAPPAWMVTVRLLSVAISSDSDLAVLADAPRLLPSLVDLTLCVRTENLSVAAWRSAFQALLPQLTALSLDGGEKSLADPWIFTHWWDQSASAVGGEGGFRRHRSDDDERTTPDDPPATAATPAVIVAAFPLERIQINYASGSHGPLLALVAAHAPNLNDIVITGEAAPGIIDALAAMPRCQSLNILLHGLTDADVARILRGGMRKSLRNCSVADDDAFGDPPTGKPLFSDVAAFDGVVCPNVRKATFLPCNDCTRSVFPNARWSREEITIPTLPGS
jgi:hypothetical protein